MEIGKATLDDLKDIIEINKFVDYENPDDFIEESINKGRVYIAQKDNDILGFLLYDFFWGKSPYLSLLKIHKNYYQSGFGAKLVEYFEQEMLDKGYKFYYSSTGEDNLGSQIFHSKMGLKEMGRLDMSYGEEIFYKKEL